MGTAEVVGVAAPGFHGVLIDRSPDVYVPLAMRRQARPSIFQENMSQRRRVNWLTVIARLEPEMTPARAEAALQPVLRSLRRGHRKLSNQFGDMTSVVQEAVSGIRLVKSFGGEEYEFKRFREASDRYARGMMRVTRLSQLAIPITETVGTGVAIIVLLTKRASTRARRLMSSST